MKHHEATVRIERFCILVLTIVIIGLVSWPWRTSRSLKEAQKQLTVYDSELFRMNESQLAKEARPFFPSPDNSVLGHEEKESIVGNFRGDTIDRLTVVPRFKQEYIEEEPYCEFFLDGKQISEAYYAEEAQYLWRVVSFYNTLPPLDVFGYHPYLVFEGDLDQNGTQEFGILDTWIASGWRYYSIYTFRDGEWKYLVEPFNTFSTLRASGKELARPGPRPGTVSITCSEMSADCPPEGRDTVVTAGFYMIQRYLPRNLQLGQVLFGAAEKNK